MEATKVPAAATWRAAVVVVTGAIFASCAACSSGATGDAPPPTTPPVTQNTTPVSPTKTSSPADIARQNALTAYRGMWQDFAAAGTTSDWQSPRLGRYATGIALTNLSRGLYADHYNGLVTKGEPILAPEVTSAEPAEFPTKIVITDCGDSTNWLKYRADNGQLADSPGGRRLINAIVEKQSDGSWKVSDFGVHDVGTC